MSMQFQNPDGSFYTPYVPNRVYYRFIIERADAGGLTVHKYKYFRTGSDGRESVVEDYSMDMFLMEPDCICIVYDNLKTDGPNFEGLTEYDKDGHCKIDRKKFDAFFDVEDSEPPVGELVYGDSVFMTLEDKKRYKRLAPVMNLFGIKPKPICFGTKRFYKKMKPYFV